MQDLGERGREASRLGCEGINGGPPGRVSSNTSVSRASVQAIGIAVWRHSGSFIARRIMPSRLFVFRCIPMQLEQ